MITKPRALITNDDGIDSYFLKELVHAMMKFFDVTVVAPIKEKSWISKAMSRHNDVEIKPLKIFDCFTWSVNGTPADCINIALGNLLDSKPDIVVSGINIGHNVTLPLILCSGTIAGALEGATWGIPALAFSMEIPANCYHQVRSNKGKVDGESKLSLQNSAVIASEIAKEYSTKKVNNTIVHNINFPEFVTGETKKIFTIPDESKIGTIFQKKNESCYIFNENFKINSKPKKDTDRECLKNGNISHTILNYSNIAQSN